MNLVLVCCVFVGLTCVKLLFINAYHSTDFEVHRNWLAITSSLPLDQWYQEATSIWTLDYPPFFAWFEYALSFAARWFDPAMLDIHNLEYDSDMTVLFQRLSVMVADLILLVAVVLLGRADGQGKKATTAASLLLPQLAVLCSFGLFIVDHIHFQYNGFLFGILLISLYLMAHKHEIAGGVVFAALLNFKHIYLYIAPAVFVFLLRGYCFTPSPNNSTSNNTKLSLSSFRFLRFLSLGVAVCVVFVASLGPFAYLVCFHIRTVSHNLIVTTRHQVLLLFGGQFPQVVSRLFPFRRGLTHAYWAANAWALYNFVDKVLSIIGPKFLGVELATSSTGSFTGGLVTDEQEHAVLPEVPPIATFVLTLAVMIPFLVYLFVHPTTPRRLYQSIALCGFASFLFGWHVHEKAALLFQIPLSLVASASPLLARGHFLAQLAGGFALFPLIFTQKEAVAVASLFVGYMLLVWTLHNYVAKGSATIVLSVWEKMYAVGLGALYAYNTLLHEMVFGKAMPFLPLMFTSVYCALGVCASFVMVYIDFMAPQTHTTEAARSKLKSS